MYEHIQIATADCIQTITLNRPDRLNAFIGHMRRDLAKRSNTQAAIAVFAS
jgi:enoyl-CoA hydratase/carnithine racemase